MKRFDTIYMLRMQSLLKARYQVEAAKVHLNFSEWIRQACEDKFKSQARRIKERRPS